MMTSAPRGWGGRGAARGFARSPVREGATRPGQRHAADAAGRLLGRGQSSSRSGRQEGTTVDRGIRCWWSIRLRVPVDRRSVAGWPIVARGGGTCSRGLSRPQTDPPRSIPHVSPSSFRNIHRGITLIWTSRDAKTMGSPAWGTLVDRARCIKEAVRRAGTAC